MLLLLVHNQVTYENTVLSTHLSNHQSSPFSNFSEIWMLINLLNTGSIDSHHTRSTHLSCHPQSEIFYPRLFPNGNNLLLFSITSNHLSCDSLIALISDLWLFLDRLNSIIRGFIRVNPRWEITILKGPCYTCKILFRTHIRMSIRILFLQSAVDITSIPLAWYALKSNPAHPHDDSLTIFINVGAESVTEEKSVAFATRSSFPLSGHARDFSRFFKKSEGNNQCWPHLPNPHKIEVCRLINSECCGQPPHCNSSRHNHIFPISRRYWALRR